jgi:hypothetical protein
MSGTRSDWAALLPTLQAFIAGEPIQRMGYGGRWEDADQMYSVLQGAKYRIKPHHSEWQRDRARAAIETLHSALPEKCAAVRTDAEPVPQGEPVAWWGPDAQLMHNEIYSSWRNHDPERAALYKPLCASPQPLTDEKIDDIVASNPSWTRRDFARAIEAAHGIGEQP